MYENRNELIKAVIKEIRTPANKIQKDNHRYIIDSYSGTDIKTIEVTDFAGHFCIIVYYKETQEKISHTTGEGLSTFKGASSWQGIILTPRSPAYKKFSEVLKDVCTEKGVV